jgi:hypothetical protein
LQKKQTFLEECYRSDIEKMKIEADIRKEEIRAKNQYEIEKLMIQESQRNERNSEWNNERTSLPRVNQIENSEFDERVRKNRM